MLNKIHNSTKYVNIPDDCLDTRIPLFSDDAFRQGIIYEAKYIGSMDVARPQNRMEIVSAMRRIRFEFKAKAVKKERIYFKISTDGVFVNLRTKKKTPIKMRLSQSFNLLNGGGGGNANYDAQNLSLINNNTGLLLMHHPIYRIFYVSHDSQDLKIFSYIARDSKSTNFKCNVFKALRKMEAMKIVRTVGQAFDVCHRLSQKESVASGKSVGGTTEDDEYSSQATPAGDASLQRTREDESDNNDDDEDDEVTADGDDLLKQDLSGGGLTSSQSAQPLRAGTGRRGLLSDDEDDPHSDSASLSTLEELFAKPLPPQSSVNKKASSKLPPQPLNGIVKSLSVAVCSGNHFTTTTPNQQHHPAPSSPSPSPASSSAAGGGGGGRSNSSLPISISTNHFPSATDSFLSSYIFLYHLLTNQVPTTSVSSASANISPSMSMPLNSIASSSSSAPSDLLGAYNAQLSGLNPYQIQLLKSQLEQEIQFRVKYQSELEELSSQNKVLSCFIRRTFECIRHGKCESCMLRLSSLDLNPPTAPQAVTSLGRELGVIAISSATIVPSAPSSSIINTTTSTSSSMVASSFSPLPKSCTTSTANTIIPKLCPPPPLPSSSRASSIIFKSPSSSFTYLKPSGSSDMTSSRDSCAITKSCTTSNFIEDFFKNSLESADCDEHNILETNEQEISFDRLDYYQRTSTGHTSRNFYKMATWTPTCIGTTATSSGAASIGRLTNGNLWSTSNGTRGNGTNLPAVTSKTTTVYPDNLGFTDLLPPTTQLQSTFATHSSSSNHNKPIQHNESSMKSYDDPFLVNM